MEPEVTTEVTSVSSMETHSQLVEEEEDTTDRPSLDTELQTNQATTNSESETTTEKVSTDTTRLPTSRLILNHAVDLLKRDQPRDQPESQEDHQRDQPPEELHHPSMESLLTENHNTREDQRTQSSAPDKSPREPLTTITLQLEGEDITESLPLALGVQC